MLAWKPPPQMACDGPSLRCACKAYFKPSETAAPRTARPLFQGPAATWAEREAAGCALLHLQLGWPLELYAPYEHLQLYW